MKKCKVCEKEKNITEYMIDNRFSDNVKPVCRKCTRILHEKTIILNIGMDYDNMPIKEDTYMDLKIQFAINILGCQYTENESIMIIQEELVQAFLMNFDRTFNKKQAIQLRDWISDYLD